MKPRISLRIAVLAASVTALALAPPAAAETARGDFAADFSSGGSLRIQVRSGDVRVEGSDRDRIAVRFEGASASRRDEVRVRLTRTRAAAARLSIDGGPKNGLRIVIEIPRQTALELRMPFGELAVLGVVGDKDVEVHAGDIALELGDPAQYGHVDGSVLSGDLSAPGFDVETGGLFRSFAREGAGSLRVHAHLGAGELVLRD